MILFLLQWESAHMFTHLLAYSAAVLGCTGIVSTWTCVGDETDITLTLASKWMQEETVQGVKKIL